MKRLRKRFSGTTIRYFACTEYGGKTFRPHYHLILYNVDLPGDDLTLYKRSKLGYNYYNSKILQDCWSNIVGYDLSGKPIYEPLGYVVVGEVTWASCAYVGRYVTKKVTGEDAEISYDRFNLERPCTMMSRRPGIGHDYIERNRDDFARFGNVYIGLSDNGRNLRSSRYVDSLVYKDNPEALAEVKAKRKEVAIASNKWREEQTSLLYEEMLEVEEAAFVSRIASLRRDIV